GADLASTNSWVTALCLSIAATSFYLSIRHRMPIITAWSTPGLALIAATAGTVTLQQAAGAFLLAAVLTVLTAAIRPLGDLVSRIPASIAAAMLAGILARFAIAIFDQAAIAPTLVLPLLVLFLVVRLFSPAGAVLAVLLGGLALTWLLGLAPALAVRPGMVSL